MEISKFTKHLSLLLVLVLLFISTIFLSNSFLTSAEPNCENPSQDELNYCIEKIQQELDALRPAHEYNKQELANLRTELSSLNKQIKGISAQLATVERNIDQREEDLAFAQEIFEAKANSHYKFIRLYDPILPFLSSNDASEAFREISFRQKAADEDRKTMEVYAEDLMNLKEDKDNLEKNRTALAAIKKKVDERESFLSGEVAKVASYIDSLSSKQKDLLEQKFASLPVPHLAYTSLRGCVSDIDVDPGFSPRFAFFSFGVPNKVGLNQYGAKGRAESGQSYEDILRAYYDNFQIVDYNTGINITVNGTNEYRQVFNNEVMNIEEYLKHLYEMPTAWDEKALKAQAIAARSYALARTNDGQNSIPPNQSGQVVKKELNDGNWIAAVEATRGKVMVYGGSPISAWYSSTHGGFVLKSGEIGWNDTPWTKHAVDAGSGSSFSDLKNTAYDKNSPWFYCDWGYRDQ
jgi:peptidoglycan hydrolase CwlO-like protein